MNVKCRLLCDVAFPQCCLPWNTEDLRCCSTPAEVEGSPATSGSLQREGRVPGQGPSWSLGLTLLWPQEDTRSDVGPATQNI